MSRRFRFRLPGTRDEERGIALVLVLLVLSLLLTVVGEFALAMRLEGITTLNFRSTMISTHLAEAAYHQAVSEILPDAIAHHLDESGLLVFRRTRTESPKVPTRQDIALGPGTFSYRITDEEARINLNRTSPEILSRLLSELGVEREARDVIVDSIRDWLDANEEHHLNGAESDYYMALPVPYRSKNANLDAVEELLQVRGVTREILYGTPESPGLAEYVTVVGTGLINANTASPLVLRALGLAQAETDLLIAGRPYLDRNQLSTQFRRPNLSVSSASFRIEAWGEVSGRVHSALTAVVQRRAGRDGVIGVTPVQWRSKEDGSAPSPRRER